MLNRKSLLRCCSRKGRHASGLAGIIIAGLAMGSVAMDVAAAGSATPYSPLWDTQAPAAPGAAGAGAASLPLGVIGVDLTRGLAAPVATRGPAVAATPHAATTLPVRLSPEWRRYISQLVQKAAQENHVEAALLYAVMRAESAYRPNAVSNKGAIGLMQVMPFTGRRFGVTDLHNPEENIKAGARYLSYLMKIFNNNRRLAVAAYNAGEQAVIRYGYRTPPFRETSAYVPRVLEYYRRYLSGKLSNWF